MNKTVSIMLVGVGGQGTLLASKILGNVLLKSGYDAKVSEVHGMAQRGGSVVTYVRFGENVSSPIVGEGDADFILAFEKLESLRYLNYLKSSGVMIVNTQQIKPMTVISGNAVYTEDIENKINNICPNAIFVDALKIAIECGSPKAVNVVMIGLLDKKLCINKSEFISSIKEIVNPKFIDMNLNAFELGYELN